MTANTSAAPAATAVQNLSNPFEGGTLAPMVRRSRVAANLRPKGAGVRPFFFLLLGSCLQFGVPETSDGGARDAGKGSDAGTASDAKAPDVEAGGDLGCIVDPYSRVTLCTSLALCPGIAVDHDRFPHCGFRAGAGIIEIACLCGEFLCPLGASLTCAQARNLLLTQFELTACLQVNEGRCAPRTIPPTGSTCDKNCAAMCGGDPGCVRLCGC
jgi:hypothetical protein